ncbi:MULTISPECIES: aldehyde ferredoxin oxidoreductase family protein [Thermococcus]|uniref:Aldehyde:ferredoxin oxidoreductase n=1 Tax=Thermococcus nautili TaxID=195522 RepID=W8P1F1_9EURY|nr:MULTISPECIES: aldehyde ferredoxin oxidoreductase family protein [Thermococcus]AHL22596.1 Aldehyde:ferredoxin oxidoreductase [Thermococcus nautili]NJE48145.1 aldehyde:ferredoxin oxidoreductase [Thermococcus sp. 9N3]
MEAKGGYWGKILRVNLTTGEIKVEPLPEEFPRKYLGGVGFGTRLLYDEVPAKADPLGPENKMIITPGLFVGTGIGTGSKTAFNFKSPLTGGYGRSMAGAKMGEELKKAGYDVLIIEGQSEEPVLLYIKDDEVKLVPANEYWGLTTGEARKKAKEEYPGFATAFIGPAGENLSLIATIDTDERQAGRGGPGAVLGSKKLKGIVVKGTKKIPIAEPEKLRELIKKWAMIFKDHPATKADMDYGSGEFLDWMNRERGTFPTRNWQMGFFKKAYEKAKEEGREHIYIDPYYWAPKYRAGRRPCPLCNKPCSQYVKVESEKWGTFMTDGPEYETLYSFGGALELDDFETVAYLNYLADELGLDTISAGVTIAWAMEAYERGLLTKEEADGLELTFGNGEAAVEALKKMAYREGNLGKLLADGVKRASERLGRGSEKFALHVKGMEPPAYDVRGIKGMALAFAVNVRGADHLTSGAYGTELVGKWWKFEGVDRTKGENKGFEIAFHENLMAIYDATGVCKFSRHMYFLEGFPELVEAVTGMNIGEAELMVIGERIMNIARAFNVREGFTRKDDTLPYRIMWEPIPEGPSKGLHVPPWELDRMLDEYYQARGWSRDGIPTKAKLMALDLPDIADDIGAGI